MSRQAAQSLLLLGLCVALIVSRPAGAAAPPAIGYSQGAVATDHALASQAGLVVLQAGGNAIDAACAAAFALGVVNPAGSGIGGGGLLVLRTPAGEVATLDFRETAPAAARREMFLAPGLAADASRRGGLAVATPGEVAGCYAAVQRYGKLPWRRILAPAIGYARDGFAVGVHLATTIRRKRAQLQASPALARLFLPAGKPLQAGQRLRRPQLARSLAAIAAQGPEVFYRGWIGREIVAAVQQSGGVLSATDLADYAVRWRTPLRASYRGYAVHAMPPPSSGGVALVQSLQVLGHIPLRPLGHNASGYLHLLAETLKHAFADRARYLGDSDFVKLPLRALTAPAYADALYARIGARTLPTASYGSPGAPRAPPPDPPGTSHISVVDKEGLAVALTTTINTAFGALLVAGSSGVLLNNEMDDFCARPGEPNAFGLVQSESNTVAPGKRPLSSMTPTIVSRDGKLVLVAGASGGPTIISGTLQALLNVLDFRLDAMQSVYRPRIHHQWLPDQLLVEAAIPRDVRLALDRRGHRTRLVRHPFTAVQLVVRRGDKLYPAADPRKAGQAAGY